MDPAAKSITADRLSQLAELGPRERAFLAGLEARPTRFRRHQIIAREGDPAAFAYVLLSGWVATYSDFPDGGRQMRRLHLPGDIVAMPSVAFSRHAENVLALSDVVVSPFPKAMMRTMTEELPRLSALMFIISQAERITLGDRLAWVGRASAAARLAFLVSDILNRLRALDRSIGTAFTLHLSREEMADFTGMTPVHASRIWSQLKQQRLIATEGATVTVLDEARLAELARVEDRRRQFDLSWLPEPATAEAIAI